MLGGVGVDQRITADRERRRHVGNADQDRAAALAAFGVGNRDGDRVAAVVGVDVAEAERLVGIQCERLFSGAVAIVDRGGPGVAIGISEGAAANKEFTFLDGDPDIHYGNGVDDGDCQFVGTESAVFIRCSGRDRVAAGRSRRRVWHWSGRP